MPEGFEIREPAETLYLAARCWEHAGDEWQAAAAQLPYGTVSGFTLGLAYHPTSDAFSKVYNDVLYETRDRLLAGVDALHDAARALRRSAEEYINVDSELDDRIDNLLAELAGPDPALPAAGPDAYR